MKFNQWTLGLAAVGAVSLASVVNAEEAKLSTLNTALSNTVISGYVDVAAQWNPGNAQATGLQPAGISNSKIDSFSANDVVVSLDKALDESAWASGYHVDLNWGTDAIAGAAGTPVRQAYVALRTPVGNGIDWKMGVIDGITGYEGNTSYLNPNYTRSYGYAINPASYTGLLGNYKVCNFLSVQAGVANRGNTFAGAPGTGFTASNQNAVGLSSKDYIASVSLTAPDSWGFLKGSTLNLQTVQGFDNGAVNNYSINGTFNTPVAGLKAGLSYDAGQTLTQQGAFPTTGSDLSWDANVYGVYASYQATDKLGLNLRYEYVDLSGTAVGLPNLQEVTATLQYDLWANVVSRLEVRWDTSEHYNGFFAPNAQGQRNNNFLLAANIVYKF